MGVLWMYVLFGVVMVLAYHSIGRTWTTRQGTGLALAIVAAWPLLDGVFDLEREVARYQQGNVTSGEVLRRLSSTGEAGTETIGRSYPRRTGRSRTVNTANGFRLHDLLARWLVTGTTDAWVVDYRYPCGTPSGCYGRDFVGHELWSRLRPGQAVMIRSVKGRVTSGRLSNNTVWPEAAVKTGIGGALASLAYLLIVGVKRRQTFVTAAAVVTAVEPVPAGDTVHWRVTFAYFDEQGQPQECSDEVYVRHLKPGDDCVVLYPKGKPDLGSLRQSPA